MIIPSPAESLTENRAVLPQTHHTDPPVHRAVMHIGRRLSYKRAWTQRNGKTYKNVYIHPGKKKRKVFASASGDGLWRRPGQARPGVFPMENKMRESRRRSCETDDVGRFCSVTKLCNFKRRWLRAGGSNHHTHVHVSWTLRPFERPRRLVERPVWIRESNSTQSFAEKISNNIDFGRV